MPWVASTPTLREWVACTAARAPGSITPMTGTDSVRCRACRPAAVAVLHAMTMSLTLWDSNQAPTCSTNLRTSPWSRGPYGQRLVSPT